MWLKTLACCAVVSSLALEAAANPMPGFQPHVVMGVPPVRGPSSSSSRRSVRRDIPASHTLHERQPERWTGAWNKVHRVPAAAVLPMRIGLKAHNTDAGHERLMAISNPQSTEYGQHMTPEEVIAFFAPPQEHVDAVVDWLVSAGIAADRIALSANKQWIQFDATTAEAEDLLMTDFYVFEHGGTNTRDIAAEQYHLPRQVRQLVDYVTPGIRLRRDRVAEQRKKRWETREQKTPRPPGRRGMHAQHMTPRPIDRTDSVVESVASLAPFNSSTCYRFVTPDCIKGQYQIPNNTRAAAGNELGVFESLGEHYSKVDMDTYFAKVYPAVPQGTYPEERLIDGATGATSEFQLAGSEANLDFQAAIPLIYPQKTVLFQTDSERVQHNSTQSKSPYKGFWNTFFDAIDGSYCSFSAFGETGNCDKAECLDPSYPDESAGGHSGYNGTLQCGVYRPTNVISISYGGGEADLPSYYWQRQCLEILKLGLQGVTVVISSGDYGVASFAGDAGHANGCAGDQGQVFYPSSEATCPYVLAVGSTEFIAAARASSTGSGSNSSTSTSTSTSYVISEVATTRFGSGGGFSNYFPMPAYQASAVAGYFDKVGSQLSFSGYGAAGTNFSTVGSGVYHRGGRGYPDVAALGDRYVVRINKSWYTIGGTSLSAPLWASMLTLVNEERLAAGRRPLGFVNPVLYLHPEVFNDVTQGSNPGCNTKGFVAAEGWDPVTGLGSPNFPKLLSLLAKL